MVVYNHDYKDRVVLELEEKEFTLVAFLIEKSKQKMQGKLKESLSETMHNQLQEFIDS